MLLLTMESANVNTVTLPTNINIMITVFPIIESCEVIPKLRPTVPIAETTSYITSFNENTGSEIDNMRVPIKISDKVNKTTA